jgi:hypothetical protein
MKTVKLYLEVEVPKNTKPADVAEALNAALDEPPCEWGEWTVGAVLVDEEDQL